MQEEFYDPTEGHGGGSIALFLALYLLVLAFFILLVSISTIEDDKSKAAIDSVYSSFSTVLPPSLQVNAARNTNGEVRAGQEFQEQVTEIFSTSIQVDQVKILEPGRLMWMRLKSDVLFESGKTDIKEVNHPLLDRIVASLSGRPPGMRYDLEFVIGSAYQSGKIMPIGETLEMLRAGSFVRAMLARGVPPDSVAVGIRPGDPEKINLWFYVRRSDEPVLTPAPADAESGQ